MAVPQDVTQAEIGELARKFGEWANALPERERALLRTGPVAAAGASGGDEVPGYTAIEIPVFIALISVLIPEPQLPTPQPPPR